MDSNTKFTHIMRQTLLRQFDEQDAALQNFYCREEGLALFMKMSSQVGTSGYIHRKKELVSHLVKAGIACSLQDSDDFIRECVDRLPKAEEMDRRLMDILYGIYVKALSPAEQIEQLVRRLGKTEYQNGSVRLAILKQFLANTTWHTRAVADDIRKKYSQCCDVEKSDLKKPDVLARLADESLFDVLKNKLSKDEKRKCTLLRVADDLATGRFRSNGGTRSALYMFAFAFEMNAYLDPAKDEYEPERDIEKNLFFDYYSNSLLRFISEDYVSHSSDYEAEPSGEGINYKNFAEAIYLYYLNRKDLTSAERLSRANACVEACVDYAENNGCGTGKSTGEGDTGFSRGTRYTYLYKDLYLMRLRSIDESRLVEFICSYYDVGERQTSMARIAVASEARSAAFHFGRFMSRRAAGDDDWQNETEDESRAEAYKKQMMVLCAPYGDRKFTQIVCKMCDMLFENIGPAKKTVSRSRMIAMAFEEFLNDQELAGLSMSELYRHFTGKVDPELEDSRYQPICSTNIFDMFVILLLYRNLNIV